MSSTDAQDGLDKFQDGASTHRWGAGDVASVLVSGGGVAHGKLIHHVEMWLDNTLTFQHDV